MIKATNKTYKLECYRVKDEPHYYFNFRCTDNQSMWEMTLQDTSKVPTNEDLAYFIAEIEDEKGKYLPGEYVSDITILSVDREASVHIDVVDIHPCSGKGQWKTGAQNVLEIFTSKGFKM